MDKKDIEDSLFELEKKLGNMQGNSKYFDGNFFENSNSNNNSNSHNFDMNNTNNNGEYDNIPDIQPNQNNNRNNNGSINKRTKKLIVIPIIVIVISIIVSIVGGIFDLKISNFVGPIVMMTCLVCIILFFRNANKERIQKMQKDKEKSAQLEQEQMFEKQNGIKYMEEHSTQVNALIKKYSNPVFNYVGTIEDIAKQFNEYNPLTLPLDCNIMPNASTLTIPFNAAITPQLRDLLIADDMLYERQKDEARNKAFYTEIANLTQYVVSELKERIKKNYEWTDPYTMSTIIYLIIRNNVIEYYHDKFEEEYKQIKNVNDYCKKFTKIDLDSKLMEFVFYYICKTDITLPIRKAYRKICSQIQAEHNTEHIVAH